MTLNELQSSPQTSVNFIYSARPKDVNCLRTMGIHLRYTTSYYSSSDNFTHQKGFYNTHFRII